MPRQLREDVLGMGGLGHRTASARVVAPLSAGSPRGGGGGRRAPSPEEPLDVGPPMERFELFG